MRCSLLTVLVLVFACSLAGCAERVPTTAPTDPPAAEPAATEASAGEDRASFLAALQAEGATVEAGEPIVQDFFQVEGQLVTVNGAELQVFEYEDPAAMEADAAQVAPDGGSIGTSMVNWIDPPHFYKSGRILVLYLGSDQAILDLLAKVLGPQFAGQ